MTLKCDHCRGRLGFSVHRYGQMRFCCASCVESYRRRLDEETRLKIGRLDLTAAENSGKFDRLRLGLLIRHLAG